MADAKRRDLERLVAAGDADAELRLLQELLRTGELSDERLRLAAYCDHPVAKQLSPVPTPERPGAWLRYWESARKHLISGIASADLALETEPEDGRSEAYAKRRATRAARYHQIAKQALELLDQAQPDPWLPDPFTWIEGLKAWGDQVAVRVGVAGARLRTWPAESESMLLRIESWLADPTPERLASVADSLQGLDEPEDDEAWGERIVERVAGLATATGGDDDLWHCLYDLSRLVGQEALDAHLDTEKAKVHFDAYHRHAWLVGQSRIHAAIRSALVPWALGVNRSN